MKLDLAEYNLQTKVYWYAMLFLCLVALGFAAFKLTDFSFLQYLVLGGSLVTSAIINKYQIKIPKTQTAISAKEFVAFWATIWLGIPGGILLAASASLARPIAASKSRRQWFFNVFVNTFVAFVSANVFYLVLYYVSGFSESVAATNAIRTEWLLIASAAMVFTHFWLFAILTSTFLTIENSYSFWLLWKKNFLWLVGIYFLGTAATLFAHLIFLEFSLGFSWVVLPAVVFAHIAYKIHQHRLAQKTKEIVEASRIHLATVEALATAIDARDQVGIGHVRRTQIYAVGMGKMLGLSDSDLNALNTGALLHDIGKLAVPDHILNKPGRLTPAEIEKIKIHASVGASILEKIDFPYPVISTVKYHHEMWDGSGYPSGLVKEEIPLTARILAVADAYDTLRGARPYRPPVSREETRRFMLNGAGTQFDPKIIDVFFRNLRHFEDEVAAQGLSYKFDGGVQNEIRTVFEDDSDQNYVEQIKRANREVFTLYELARVFSSSLNLQETLSLFVEKIGGLVPFDSCAVYLLVDSSEIAVAVHAEGKNASSLKNKRVQLGEGATGFALKTRQPVYKVDPGMDFTHSQVELTDEYSAIASLPLISEEKLVGAVSLYSCGMENYEEEHMRLLETVSRIASDAICVSLQHAESESRALTDPMTNLPNARSLQMQFEKEAARADRGSSNFQVLMLDLDGFKAVNDTHGHKIGDLMLKEVAKAMRGQLRDYDFLARYAGDEFVAVVPETDSREIKELCERMEKAVYDFILPVGNDEYARVGVSIGAACYPTDGATLDQVIIAADKAMYAEKAVRKRKIAMQAELDLKAAAQTGEVSVENFIVELDESHIVSSALN